MTTLQIKSRHKSGHKVSIRNCLSSHHMTALWVICPHVLRHLRSLWKHYQSCSEEKFTDTECRHTSQDYQSLQFNSEDCKDMLLIKNEVKKRIPSAKSWFFFNLIRLLGAWNLNTVEFAIICVWPLPNLFFLYITFKTKQWSVGALYFTLCWEP